MAENEEINLMKLMANLDKDMRKLQKSVDGLTEAVNALRSEPIMLLGALVYDYVEEFKELKELFKWYAERTTHRKYPEE